MMTPRPPMSTPSTEVDGGARAGSLVIRLAAAGLGGAGALLSAPAVALAVPFWAVRGLTRRLAGSNWLQPRALPWPDLLQYVPEVGWRTRPGLDAYGEADGVFHFTTDDEGWRGRRRLDEADVLVFGDSYAFGHGVNDADMYSEHADGLAVKPMGSDGYSMVHAVLWMERLSIRLRDKIVVWMVYTGNDLYDNLRPNYGVYRMPYVRWRDGSWEIHTAHVSPERWPIAERQVAYATELARLCTPGYETERALDAANYLLERARDAVRAAGAKFLVLCVPPRDQIDPKRLPSLRSRSPEPARFDPLLLDRELARRCAKLGIPFVPLAEHLTTDDYQKRDIHWTPAGNEKVGGLLAGFVRDLP